MQVIEQLWVNVCQFFIRIWNEMHLAVSDYQILVDTRISR